MTIDVPQDRNSTFAPKVVKKRQKDISDIDQKIISMYAKGMTTRQISDTLMDIYGFEASEGFISDVTDKLMPQIEECLQHGIATPATVVDHIIPHRGDPKLFWDKSNWQALCKKCHDRKTGREDSNPTYRY